MRKEPNVCKWQILFKKIEIQPCNQLPSLLWEKSNVAIQRTQTQFNSYCLRRRSIVLQFSHRRLNLKGPHLIHKSVQDQNVEIEIWNVSLAFDTEKLGSAKDGDNFDLWREKMKKAGNKLHSNRFIDYGKWRPWIVLLIYWECQARLNLDFLMFKVRKHLICLNLCNAQTPPIFSTFQI